MKELTYALHTTKGAIVKSSHYSENVWQTAVTDTLSKLLHRQFKGKTEISQNSAINMLHKILLVLMTKLKKNPTKIKVFLNSTRVICLNEKRSRNLYSAQQESLVNMVQTLQYVVFLTSRYV